MTRTFKALSALLSYPTPDLKAAVSDIRTVLRDEAVLSPDAQRMLEPLLTELAERDVYDLQERYVFLFDRSRSLSLNLFEHIHGESRDRGGAMVDLLETYRAGGFELESTELPDHLPVLLEFLGQRPLAESAETLGDAAHIVAALADRLERRESRYAGVLRALVTLADGTVDEEVLAGLTAQPLDDPTDLEALDEVWEEAMVTFGPDPNAGCPATRDILNRMSEPPSKAQMGAPQ